MEVLDFFQRSKDRIMVFWNGKWKKKGTEERKKKSAEKLMNSRKS